MKTKLLIPLLAGIGLFCACKGKGTSEYEVINNSSSDSVKTDSATIAEPKLVKSGGISFKVRNVQQTTEHLALMTSNCNGLVIHHRMASTPERSLDMRISDDSVMRVTSFNTTAEMTIKIPSLKLEEFINRVARLGIYVNEINMDITDKTLDYLSAQMKLKSRTELVSQQKKGKIEIKKPEDVLLLKDDMTDQQISNLSIDDAVKTSIVTLNFYESNTIKKEILANDDPSAYNLSFFKRLGLALQNGFEMLKELIIAIANIWTLIPIGFGTWMLIKHYRVKKTVVVKN